MFNKHPKGLIAASFANLGERFGFYTMMAILVLFLQAKFGLDGKEAGLIYSTFYFSIYILALIGGIIADRTRNYKGTIFAGIVLMAVGYLMLAIPSPTPVANKTLFLVITCAALFVIAFGNGLFKGNLQALVGQMYDNPQYSSMRDSGFSLFYMFINVGAIFAPFAAVGVRNWWLSTFGYNYDADLPALCHGHLAGTLTPEAVDTYSALAAKATISGTPVTDMTVFANEYLNVFTTGFHYAFGVAILAMVLSLVIFVINRKKFPDPSKKVAAKAGDATIVEMSAQEVRQRMYALFAVFGVVIFFWFSFHQNGQSLSVFARDFVKTDNVAPEIWQCINPFFVIVLTPIIMWIFAALARRNKDISTPKKIAFGMAITAMAYVFLMVVSIVYNYPSGEEFKGLAEAVKESMKAGPVVLILTYFFLTVAELFISPLGLSFVSKIAPKHLQGICQGLWLSSTAIGNLFIALGVTMLNSFPYQWECWAVFAGLCLLSMTVMFSMVNWLERVTK